MDIKTIVENNDTVPGRVFDLGVQMLILLSVITFSIETLPDLSAGAKKLLGITEVIRLVPADNSLIFINFMSRLRAKRTDSLTNRFFLLSIRPV